MSELEKYQPPQIADLNQWAQKLYESGNFTDTKNIAQAFVKIAAGAELGLSPFQSMSGVHLIQGKPVVGAGLLASLLDRDPAYDYRTDWEPDEKAPEACTITVFKNGVERGKSRFSLEDAKRAGILRDNWLKYPSAMLFARAMSQAVRWYAPGATGGSVYVEGELQQDAPASRVTATVQRFHDPVEDIPASAVEVEPDGTGLPVEPVSLGTVTAQIKQLSLVERSDLYGFCGIEGKLSAAEAHALFTAKADEFGVAFSDPPDIHAILTRARLLNRREDGAEEFDRFAKTGEDTSPGGQTSIAGEVLA